MHRIFSMCLDAAIAAIIVIPLFLYINKRYFHDTKRTVGYILFSIYLSAMFAVVGLPDIRYVRFSPHFNFIPFQYMFSDFTNSFLNVLLFVPLGIFLPLFWQRFRKCHSTVFQGFCTSLLIEVLQIFTFRATDVNDLMTNTMGTLIGWCTARTLLHFIPGITPGKRQKEIYLIYGISFAIMFFLHPFFADWIWMYFKILGI